MPELRCESCRALATPGTVICRSCGGLVVTTASTPFQAPAGLAADSLRVCPGCGVIAPTSLSSCKWCATPFASPPAVAWGAVDTALWGHVAESDFACRACGLRTPVPLTFGGEADCVRCGIRQVFEPNKWQAALSFLHDVLDLAGPGPLGRFPQLGLPGGATDYQSIGVEHALVERSDVGLRFRVGPGHPLCKSCHVPLAATVGADGRTEVACPSCSDRATYALPAGANVYAPELRTVLGDEYRVDRPNARLAPPDAAGVSAILCPSCGAPLRTDGATELVTCTYCSTTSRIGRRGWSRASGAMPPYEPFWVLLDGPGPTRRERLAQASRGS